MLDLKRDKGMQKLMETCRKLKKTNKTKEKKNDKCYMC